VSEEGIEKLIRPNLAAFGGYSSAKSPEILAKKMGIAVENIIKLDANENPYGCSPRVNKALVSYPYFNTYPDAGQTELRELLAGYTGIDAGNIVAGSGSDELIDLILRLFIKPGDEVISCPPTFDMFRFSTRIGDGRLVEVPRDKDFAISTKAVKGAVTKKTKIILLANPNNPTGTLTPRQDILEIINTGLPVVVDEAYYEFSGVTMAPQVNKYPNLIVLRTFSKWAGLAGLRVGYGIFPANMVEYLMKIKQPYNVNAAAQLAALESLGDLDYLRGTIKVILKERQRLMEKLGQLDWLKVYPSQSNFILCRVLKGNATAIHKELQKQGIFIRYFDTPQLRDCLRISVGKPEHTDKLIAALKRKR